MISYYELLGMIKEDKAPNKIKVHLTSTPKIYKKDDDIEEYCYYVIDDDEETNENYKYYLTESYLESMMFEKNIEILEEEKKIPEKLSSICACSDFNENEEKLAKNINILKNKYNEIIDYLDYLKSKGDE